MRLRICMRVVAAPVTEVISWWHQPKLVQAEPARKKRKGAAQQEPRSRLRFCYGTNGGFPCAELG